MSVRIRPRLKCEIDGFGRVFSSKLRVCQRALMDKLVMCCFMVFNKAKIDTCSDLDFDVVLCTKCVFYTKLFSFFFLSNVDRKT